MPVESDDIIVPTTERTGETTCDGCGDVRGDRWDRNPHSVTQCLRELRDRIESLEQEVRRGRE